MLVNTRSERRTTTDRLSGIAESAKTVDFSHGAASLRDFEIIPEKDDKQRRRTTMLAIKGVPYETTDRFWNSLLSRYGQSESVFNIFDHAEVFERIIVRKGDEQLQFTVEETPMANRLLALASDDTQIVDPYEVVKLFQRFDGVDVQYGDGLLSARFVPKSGDKSCWVGQDEFRNRFVMETPVDGWGKPKTFLEMLRLLCSNGMVGVAPAFRSLINPGDDPINTLTRTLETYDDGDGFTKFKDRIKAAQTSWASAREVEGLRKVMSRHIVGQSEAALNKLTQVTGDFGALFGVASLSMLPKKKLAVLPSTPNLGKGFKGCTVYELLNFASELATHHVDPVEGRAYQAYLGELLTDEFDLEGYGPEAESREFTDFLIN